MDEKLRRLMKHEGINSTRLAEILGIQASGISHIMSGRNKPSYDFLLKLLQRFPQINPDWLLLDKGPMYRNEIKNGVASGGRTGNAGLNTGVVVNPGTGAVVDYPPATLAGNTTAPPAAPVAVGSAPAPAQRNIFEPDNNDIIPVGVSGQPPSNIPTSEMSNSGGFTRSSSIERIVVFYKDKTFSEYRPE